MILTSTADPVRYTAPWREQETAAPVYLLRAGSVRERAQFEAELSGVHRAGRVFGFELRAAVREGVMKLLADDPDLDRVMEVLSVDDEDGLPADDAQLLADVRKVLAEHYAPYRDLIAQLERRRELAPIEALRRFLTGFENVDATFARDRDGMVSESTLAALDPFEMMAVGNRAYSLLYGGGDQERNFPPRSSSDADQSSSRTATSKAAGSSAKRRGPKTRV